MDDYKKLSREEVHAFLEQSLADLEELRGEHAGDEETIGAMGLRVCDTCRRSWGCWT